MNRGIARRTVFESREDVRYFLAQVARAVRAGWIEVHAFCLMTTHFHLLVRSPSGALSTAMRAVQNQYVRWFNRGRRRDGSLFRGRFCSRVVEGLAYREQLVRYIDFNPVLAGVVSAPSLYPHGSARWYALDRGPPWLSRRWVERAVCEVTRTNTYDPRRYAECFGEPLTRGSASVIERRLTLRARGADSLDDLLGASPEKVLSWMRRKVRLADGTAIDLPVCDAQSVNQLIGRSRVAQPDWPLAVSRKSVDAWSTLQVGLLRELCGLSWAELALLTARSESGVAQCYGRHRRALDQDATYAQTAACLARVAIEECFGARRPVDRLATEADRARRVPAAQGS